MQTADVWFYPNDWSRRSNYLFLSPAKKKLWEGNVFSRVCPLVCPQGGTMWPLPMMHWTLLYRLLVPCCSPGPLLNIGLHCTGTPQPLTYSLSSTPTLDMDPLPRSGPSLLWTWDLTVQGPQPLVVASGSQDWRPGQTCSMEDSSHHQHLVTIEAHMVCTSGR